MATTLTNHLSGYSDINSGTNIQFKVGYQSALNQMIAAGNAEEGTFYLTSDTHKLYIGRKRTSDNKIIPEQVSRGVTVVGTSSELPTPHPSGNTPADAPSGAIEEGELYYITDTNVLAALREKKQSNGTSYNPKQYEWVQINPPTGINSVEGNAVQSTNDVIVNNLIKTDGGNNTGKTKFIAGSNITLTANGQETIDGVKTAKMTIAATDTTYTIGTETTSIPTGQTIGNDAILELRTNGQDDNSNNTKVHITGANSVAVTSDNAGNISVKGPTISAVTVGERAASAGYGFLVGLTATDGQGNTIPVTSAAINPVIKYGQSGATSTTGVKFDSGEAELDIYTKTETDDAIAAAITDKLSTANAMTYRGTVSNDQANNKTFKEVLREKVIANGGAHNGDVYKVTGLDATYTMSDGSKIDVGDLLIISGEEATSGTFEGQILVGNTGVSGTVNSYTATSAYTADGILALCDLVPSGDEPELEAVIVTQTANTTPTSIQLRDGKNSVNTNILTTTFQGVAPSGASGNPASKILVTSSEENVGSGKKIDVKIAHAATARNDSTNGDKNNLTLSANGTAGTDTLGSSQYTFYVLKNGYSDLKTDVYGHVTGLQTAPVTISHNRVNKLKATYGINDNSGIIYIDRYDSVGGDSTGLADANKAQIKLTSSTLSLVGNNTTGSQQLSLNLVWQTF